MQIQLFDARMLAPLVAYLETNGDRSEALLNRVRIPAELVAAGGWITKKQAYDFTHDVVKRSGCRDAVFTAYLSFQLEHLGPIADAMRSCRTVKESLEVGARLGSTAYEGNEYFLEGNAETTWFCYREPDVVSAGQTYINDMTLAVYYRLICATVGADWRPDEFRIRGAPIDRHISSEIFRDCRAEGHLDATGLAFPTEFLSRRLRLPQQSESTSAWQFGPDESAPFVERLHRLLASRFHVRKLPTLEHVAQMIGASPSSIKRQLTASGMSYTGLLDRIRFDSACELLAMPDVGVGEIAHELGYSGTNNFVRSFRRMTGMTPGQYRRDQPQ